MLSSLIVDTGAGFGFSHNVPAKVVTVWPSGDGRGIMMNLH